MSDLDTKFLQLAKTDEEADEILRITSIIPKFEGEALNAHGGGMIDGTELDKLAKLISEKL